MQRGHKPDNARPQRKQQRQYRYAPAYLRQRRSRQLTALLLCGTIVFSAWQLISYGADFIAARNTSTELRELYHAPQEEPAAPPAASAPPATETPLPPTAAPAPSPTEAGLPELRYPDNPYALVTSRFQQLRREYGDVVGWLTIDGLLDEAVVQRDNIYYLTRDVSGRDNVNGALFLDEFISLKTRPYTLVIYGHNMRTGAMFGGLRNYENPVFYRRSPFVTFDSMCEDGRYVIFSVAELSMNPEDSHYFDLASLNARDVLQRSEAIAQLQRRSVIITDIDVQPGDQLLLLVTCVDDEDDRRIVTARRIRTDETEDALLAIARKAQRK